MTLSSEQRSAIDALRTSGLVVIVLSPEEVHESGLNVDELHNALSDVVMDAHWRICRQDDRGLDGDELADKYGADGEHPQHQRADFDLAKTDLFYWDWVAGEITG